MNDLSASSYTAVITREQFLFYEMLTTAKLMSDGLEETDVVNRVVKDNLFQYPTEKSLNRMVHTCIRRLKSMNNDALIDSIAKQPSDTAKQICLYAMMCQYHLVMDFMLTVIGSKYKNLDTSFSKSDLKMFFINLQEQNDQVASWSDSTITKIRQVLMKILVENDYLDNINSDHLNQIFISPLLKKAICEADREFVLPAFNCFD